MSVIPNVAKSGRFLLIKYVILEALKAVAIAVYGFWNILQKRIP